jgi:hypothetical protein
VINGHRQDLDLTEISLAVTGCPSGTEEDPKRRRRPAIPAVLLLGMGYGSSNHYVATSNDVCVSSLLRGSQAIKWCSEITFTSAGALGTTELAQQCHMYCTNWQVEWTCTCLHFNLDYVRSKICFGLVAIARLSMVKRWHTISVLRLSRLS